ncbi:GIP, partial [Symbiodinium sp. CCMP2456]
LSYVPRAGAHARYRKAGPLTADVTEAHQDIPENATDAEFPVDRDISLAAAEVSARNQLERIQSMRKGAGSKAKSKPPPSEPKNNRSEEESTSSSPISPGTIVIPDAEIPAHPGRKASRPNEVIPENLEYDSRASKDEIEALAKELLRDSKFDYDTAEAFLENMNPRTWTPTRTASTGTSPTSFSISFGLFAHGNMAGLTRATRQMPLTCQYLNGCLKQWRPESKVTWTSFTIGLNVKSKIHIDAHNYDKSWNMTCTLGSFSGGELWLEMLEDDGPMPSRLQWETKNNGERAPGRLLSSWRNSVIFHPKTYHKTRAWTGRRWLMASFTARSIKSLDVDDRAFLRRVGFPLPSEPITRPAIQQDMLATIEDNEETKDLVQPLLPEDQESITEPLLAIHDSLEDIFLEYPSPVQQDVLHLCDPWIEQDRCENDMQDAGLRTTYAGFYEGCDLGTHAGYVKAQELMSSSSYRWVVVHVPRGPESLFSHEVEGDWKLGTRAKRYLKLIRHLLLLSQRALQKGARLIWVMSSQSRVLELSEARHFWRVHGRGDPFLWTSGVRVVATDVMIRNTLSTTTSGVLRPPIEGASAPVTDVMSRNTVSTTTSGVLCQSIWQQMAQCLSSRLDEVLWSQVEGGHVLAVDTTVLNTMTTEELSKLMESVRQLHRRFGHPSNKLLIKNLEARNADPKIIAAASQLRCDECLEGRIKLPSPVVNLERCDKLWSCLQVDGFDFKYKNHYHHFVLLVDEASGYAVVREAYVTHEDQGRNLTTQELMAILEEGWYQYFGYPEVLKMDLEGSHRGKLLREECFGKGI